MLQPSPPLLLLVRSPWPCLLVCWMQVLSLLAQQHWFFLWDVDVHLPFLPPFLDKEAIGVFCQSGSLAVPAAAVPGARGWRWEEGSCWELAPDGSSSPLDRFLAESPSHTYRCLLRSGLSEAWTAGALAMGWNVGRSCDSQQYGLLRIDGLNLTVRHSGGVVAGTWTCRLPCFHTLLSAYILRCFLTLGFCPFFACSLLHIAASLLCLLYLQTRTGATFRSLTEAENKITFS